MSDDSKLPKRVIAVLGMHRSGTSCVTGSLQQYGLFLGQHSTWNRHNTRGNHENQAIVDLNDAVLESNGGDWLQPPDQIRWTEQQLQTARHILAEYADQELFGFKDPRSLVTLSGWQSILGPRLTFIGVYRNPWAVAQSLYARDQIAEAAAFRSWQSYNQRLLDIRRQQRFPMLCFDWPQAHFERKIARITKRLGLQRIDAETFYTADLKHHDVPSSQLPSGLQWMLRRLNHYSRPPGQWF